MSSSPTHTDEEIDLDRARAVAEKVGSECLEDVRIPYSDEALEAAALLRDEDKGAYAVLRAEIKASTINTNEWQGAVKDKQREIRADQTQKRRQSDGRPAIVDRADLHEMVDEACEALQGLGGIYEHGGELCEIVEDEEGPKRVPITKGRTRELLSRAARWEKPTKDGHKPIKPPRSVADSVHGRGSWGLDRLRGFVEGACMLEDGTILCTEGYHPGPELYVRRSVDIHGLRNPSRDDAIQAYERLTDLLCDFELDDERAAHEAAWTACLLTILARPAIGSASTPLFLFDANRPRVGKTRMAEMAYLIATGRSPTPQPAPSGRDSDAEMSKTITGIARSGVPVVFFDNVKGKLGGSSLELAITARRWSARILGESKTFEGPLLLTWIATSNNCQLTTDMHGRTLLARIKTDLEHPELRTGFKYPNIMEHVREHRAEYLRDALTILRAWHCADQPEHGLTPWGSFEAWGRIIRNAIVFAGGADPCETREGLIEADAETRGMRAILATWPTGAEYTSSELARGMRDGYLSHGGKNHRDVTQALEEFLPSKSPRSIGYRLGSWVDRVIDGRRLVRDKDSVRNVAVWRVESVE